MPIICYHTMKKSSKSVHFYYRNNLLEIPYTFWFKTSLNLEIILYCHTVFNFPIAIFYNHLFPEPLSMRIIHTGQLVIN